MAERFDGATCSVHFANDVLVEILHAWLELADRLPRGPDVEAVTEFLESRLELPGGRRSFSLSPPPAEIAAPGRLAVLAGLVAEFARDLAREEPDPELTDVEWDRDLRLLWLAQMCELHDLVRAANPPDAAPLPTLAPDLPEADRLRVELLRLLDRKYDVQRRAKTGTGEVTSRTVLDLLDRIVALAEQEPPSEYRTRTLIRQHSDRSEAYLDLGDRPAAAEALRTAAALVPEEAYRQALWEMAEDIERAAGKDAADAS